VFYVKKGKCFSFFIKRKILFCDESYFLFTGINFFLLIFFMIIKYKKIKKLIFKN